LAKLARTLPVPTEGPQEASVLVEHRDLPVHPVEDEYVAVATFQVTARCSKLAGKEPPVSS
jgi:hypothetical protein